MTAGLRSYRQVLGDAEARRFSAAGFVARLPLSMTGMGIVLLVSLTSGSFARAGLLAAVVTLTGACTAPGWGWAIDRVGQARVLVAAAVLNSLGLVLLIAAVLRDWPLPVGLAAALAVGLGFSSAGASVRARWSHRLGTSPLLQTAFALEAVLDEVVFIVGPVVVTVLATRVHPASGLALSALVGLAGAVLLAAQRRSQPPVSTATRTGDRPPLRRGTVIPLTVAMGALGMIFGAMEVVVVAFARERGLLPVAGAFITAWSLGSLIAGVVTGGVAWRRPAAQRFRIAGAALAVSLLPLPFLSGAWPVAGLMLLSGMAIAPTLIAGVAVVQGAVPPARLTEALGWNSTGLAVGLAAGAATAGALIDAAGSAAGFGGVAAAGLLLVAASLFVRVGRAGSGQVAEVATQPVAGVERLEAGGDDLVQREQAVDRPRRE